MGRKLNGAVVVITGASSGIGRATATEFAREGAALVLAARRERPLEALASDCEKLGARAIAVPTDVTDEAKVEALARRAVDTFGRIDVWLNNAAVTAFGPFEELPPEVFRRVVETNFFGYVHGARAAIRRFREQGSGVLINVASVLGKAGAAYVSGYTASKYAVVGLAESLRQELVDEPDIQVSTILPASIDTPLFQHGANYMGRAAKPMEPVYDPRLVARAIVAAARNPKKEVFVGEAAGALALVRQVAPGVYDRMAARQVRRDHFSNLPAAPNPGNLFEPKPEHTGVDGGWGHPTPGVPGTVLPAVGMAAAATFVGLLAVVALGRQGGSRRRRFLPGR